jgi:hypothetical protein
MLSIFLIIFNVNKAWYLGAILQKLKKLKIERWGLFISEPNPIFFKIKEFMTSGYICEDLSNFVLGQFWSNVN